MVAPENVAGAMINPITLSTPIVCRPFLGRDRELAELLALRRAAMQQRGSIVLVTGDAGIGKTRLVREFCARTRGRVFIAESACHAFAEPPLAALVQIIRTYAQRTPLEPKHAADLAILERLAQSSRPGPNLDKDGRLAALARLVGALCERRALVAIIEDLHWADAATLELLEYLREIVEGNRILIIGTYRSDELHRKHPLLPVARRLMRASGVRELRIPPLDLPTTHAFALAAIGEHHVAPEVLRAIIRRVEGNPFMTEELLRSAVDSRTDEEVELPDSVRGAVAERFARLGSEAERVLLGAAVIGRQFQGQFLARMLEAPYQTVLAALQWARDLQLIVEQPNEDTFAFRHGLTHEAIYAEMLSAETRPMHARIVAALENDPQDANLAALAYHAWAARDHTRSIRYNEIAGDRALEQSAYEDAARLYERAVRTATDEQTALRLQTKIADAWYALGYLNRSYEARRKAMACAHGAGDLDAIVELTAKLAISLFNGGQAADAIELLDSTLSELGDTVTPAQQGRLLAHLANLHVADGDNTGALRILERLSPEIREQQPVIRQAYHSTRVRAFAELAEVDRWRVEMQKYLEGAIAMPRPVLVVEAYFNAADSAVQLAEPDMAQELTRRGIELADEHTLLGLGAAHRALRAYSFALGGKLTEARNLIEEALGLPNDLFAAEVTLVRAALYLGTLLADDRLISRVSESSSAERLTRHGAPVASVVVGAHFAAVEAARGHQTRAQALLRRAVFTLRNASGSMVELLTAVELGDALTVSRAHDLVREAASRPADRVMQAALALVDAKSALRMGHHERAQARAREASDRFGAIGYPIFEARAKELADDPVGAANMYKAAGALGPLRTLEGSALSMKSASSEQAAVLSSRERQVAKLAVDGRSNRQIADTLDISTKTVEKLLTSVYGKLGVHSRGQLATLAAPASV